MATTTQRISEPKPYQLIVEKDVAILADPRAGVMTAAADPRREAYALRW